MYKIITSEEKREELEEQDHDKVSQHADVSLKHHMGTNKIAFSKAISRKCQMLLELHSRDSVVQKNNLILGIRGLKH